MIDVAKLMRLEMQAERMADARRSRGERYRGHILRSKDLRTRAVLLADDHVQSMSLAELLKISDAELAEAGVDVNTLKHAALARRLAEEELRAPPQEEADFAALSTLAQRCREHAGDLE